MGVVVPKVKLAILVGILVLMFVVYKTYPPRGNDAYFSFFRPVLSVVFVHLCLRVTHDLMIGGDELNFPLKMVALLFGCIAFPVDPLRFVDFNKSNTCPIGCGWGDFSRALYAFIAWPVGFVVLIGMNAYKKRLTNRPTPE